MIQNPKTHLNKLKRSATFAINERSDKLANEGKTIYRFGFGQSPFPIPDMVTKTLQENASRKNYLPVDGLFELRQSVAKYHQHTDTVAIEPEQVLIGPGSKELIFTLQLVIGGSTIIPTPCWVSYGPQGQILKRKTEFIQTNYADNWRLLPNQLTKTIKGVSGPHLLILNYPGNPDGLTYNQDELEKLANICRKNNVIILSDEIYGRLHHKGKHISIARFYPEGTIISSGLSKWCAAGGWRLGHFAFPKELKNIRNTMACIASETYSCVTTPVQYAAVEAYRDQTNAEEYLYHCRRILATIGNYCYTSLNNANVKIQPPAGSFYMFPDFKPFKSLLNNRNIHDSETLCEKLLQDTGVALLPGSVFGRSKNELNARLAYVNFDGALALQNSRSLSKERKLTIDHLGDIVAEVKQGINHIITWLER